MHVSAAVAASILIFGQDWRLSVVTAVVFVFMLIVLSWAVTMLVKYRRKFEARFNALRTSIETVLASTPAESRSTARNFVEGTGDAVVIRLWEEFDKTLVTSADGKRVFATVDAEHLLNADTLCPEYSRNRLLAAVPGMLATVGVLGTFISLAIGLSGINIGATAGTDVLTSGVQGLITAAGFAFYKSVVGVFFSLVITIWDKLFEWRVARTVGALQREMDDLYSRTTPERSLVTVADNTQASAEALQELHERIGDRLQETVETMSTGIEAALREAIASALQPAMEKLVTTTSEQSSVVFENLVEKFASSFTDIGAKQSAMLDESSGKLNDAIAKIGDEFTELVRHSQAHSLVVAERQAEILDSLTTTRDALLVSSADLKSTATSLSEVSDRIHSAGEALGSRLTETAATLTSLYENAIHEAAAAAELRELSAATDSDLTGAANRIAEATLGFGEMLSAFGTTQQEFHKSLRSGSEEMADALRTHVSDLENQVGRWLADYSTDIEKQIVNRMSLWNTHSQDYASNMLTTAKVLAEVLDDIQMTRASETPLDLETAS